MQMQALLLTHIKTSSFFELTKEGLAIIGLCCVIKWIFFSLKSSETPDQIQGRE